MHRAQIIISPRMLGSFMGFGLVGSLFVPPLYLFLLLGNAFSKTRLNKQNIVAASLCILMLAWVLLKSFLLSNPGKEVVYIVFPLIVVFYFQVKQVDFEKYKGLINPVLIIFILDLLFNVYGLMFGMDPLGRVATARPDEIYARHGGIMNHTFFSAIISLTTLLICGSVLAYRRITILAIFNLLATGTYRSVIYIVLYFVYVRLIHKFKWYHQCLLAVLIGISIMLGTWASIAFGVLQEGSGNYYRIVAWASALNYIGDSPFAGYWGKFEAFDADEGMSVENIVESGVTESAILGDAVRWGLPFALAKFFLLLFLSRKTSQLQSVHATFQNAGIDLKTIQFIPFLIVVDYIMGSAWGSVLFCTFSAIAMALKTPVPFARQALPSHAT